MMNAGNRFSILGCCLVVGASTSAFGEARMFLLPPGVSPDSVTSCDDPGDYNCTDVNGNYRVQGKGGYDVMFDIYAEDCSPALLRAHQVWFDCFITGGTAGQLNFPYDPEDPNDNSTDGVDVDWSRPDYVFYDLPWDGFGMNHQCDHDPYNVHINGARAFNICREGYCPEVTSAKYISTWWFNPTTDAQGTFMLRPYCPTEDGCSPSKTWLVECEPGGTGEMAFTVDHLIVDFPLGSCRVGQDCTSDLTQYYCEDVLAGTFRTNVVCEDMCWQDQHCDDANGCTLDTCDWDDPNSGADGCAHTPIDCDDDDVCTEDSCDPPAGCVYEYHVRLYADVYPLPDGDEAVEGFDILCVLDAANELNTYGCLTVTESGFMAGDIYPCDPPDGAVEGFDILAVLDAANDIKWCADQCPPQ